MLDTAGRVAVQSGMDDYYRARGRAFPVQEWRILQQVEAYNRNNYLPSYLDIAQDREISAQNSGAWLVHLWRRGWLDRKKALVGSRSMYCYWLTTAGRVRLTWLTDQSRFHRV